MTFERFLDDLKTRIDIVDIVSKYTVLKRSGRSYTGKSPFRNERTASFFVHPERQFWYDFGASEGGDAIKFIEKIRGISFMEAVIELAKEHNMTVPESTKTIDYKHKNDEKEVLKNIHNDAQEYFLDMYTKHNKASEYLLTRQIIADTKDKWGIGYGGDDNNGLSKYLLLKGYTHQEIQKSGVSYELTNSANTMRDRFYGRITLPIYDAKNGYIIGFTGRDIMNIDGRAKYINSPENTLYNKSDTLFGMHIVRHNKDIYNDGVVLVEGNFDVIMAHQSGIHNVIATCGTSLTDAHIQYIKRITKRITLCFDSDKAGKTATIRALQMLLPYDIMTYIVPIKEPYKDIDDALKHDKQYIIDTIHKRIIAIEYLINAFYEKYYNGHSDGIIAYLDAIFPLLMLISQDTMRYSLLEMIAHKLHKPIDMIQNDYNTYHKKNTKHLKRPSEREVQRAIKQKKLTREEEFLGLISAYKELIEYTDNDVLEHIDDDTIVTIIQHLKENKALNSDDNEYVQRLLATILQTHETLSDYELERVFTDYITYFKNKQVRKKGIL